MSGKGETQLEHNLGHDHAETVFARRGAGELGNEILSDGREFLSEEKNRECVFVDRTRAGGGSHPQVQV